MGNLPEHRRPSIAIIGTRKPTAYGRQVTEMFASQLASKGVIIVSGLALGVDAIAHQATLDSGGTTIAVLANALPDIRPMTNRYLGEQIVARGGAIISEMDETKPLGKWSFLERNRLVAGIADAILITEASSRSGTLNTAARALEQGKDVFVVPGNITSPAVRAVTCSSSKEQYPSRISKIFSSESLQLLLRHKPNLHSERPMQKWRFSPSSQLACATAMKFSASLA